MSSVHGARGKAWRWELANQLVNSGVQVSRRADPVVIEAVRFLRLRKAGAKDDDTTGTVAARELRAATEYAEMDAAEHIYRENGMYRWSIEALVLGNEDPAFIAEHTGFCVNTIHVYEKLFFDLRDRLGAFLCIHHECFGTKTCLDVSIKDHDVGWKYIAYYLGAKTLYMLWELRQGDDSQNQYCDRLISTQLRKLALVGQFSRIITPESQAAIGQEWLSMKQAEKGAVSSERHIDEMANGIQSLRDALSLSLAPLRKRSEIAIEPHVSGIVQRIQQGRAAKLAEGAIETE